MKAAYHNMGGPPRTRVQKVVRPVGEYLVFSFELASLEVPGDAAALTPAERNARIADWLQAFVREHAAALDAAPRPTGFSIGMDCKKQGGGSAHALFKQYPDVFTLCSDPVLTVAVLGRLSDTLYVPRRELRFTCDCPAYTSFVAFPMSDFPADADLEVMAYN